MAVVRKWDGVGVTNGTLGSKVGAGDDAFDTSGASPAVVNEAVECANSTAHRWAWTGLSLGAIGVRFYAVMRNAPGGTSTLFEARGNSGANRIFGLSVNSSNQIALRNSANSAVYTSSALTIGTLYRIDLWKASGNSTVSIRIVNEATGAELSGSGSPGVSTTVDTIEFGQMSGTNNGGWRFLNMRVDDADARIGAYVPGGDDYDVAFTTYSEGEQSLHTIPLPDTAYGDQLLIVLRVGGSSETATPPPGFTQLATVSSSGNSYAFHRVATGAEGEDAVVTLSGAAYCSAIVYRVRNAVSVGYEAGSGTTTSTHDPGLGSERILWLAAVTNRRSDSLLTVAPTGFNGTVTVAEASSTSTTRARVSGAATYATAETLAAGAFASTGTVDSPHAFIFSFENGDPGEPPAPGENLEYFIWDGVALEEVDLLGALEEA